MKRQQIRALVAAMLLPGAVVAKMADAIQDVAEPPAKARPKKKPQPKKKKIAHRPAATTPSKPAKKTPPERKSAKKTPKFCRACGAKLKPDKRFCPQCGEQTGASP